MTMDTRRAMTSLRRPRLRFAAAALVLASTALVACGDDDTSATTAAAGELTIEDVWARTSAGAQTNGAAYMVIAGGGDDDRLVAASVPTSVAARTEVHETVAADEAESDMDMEGAEGESDMDMEGAEGEGDMDMDMEGMQGMTMQEVEGIDVPAGETVALEPGGFHVMMIDLAEPLVAGETIELTLTFEFAGERTVMAEVRDA